MIVGMILLGVLLSGCVSERGCIPRPSKHRPYDTPGEYTIVKAEAFSFWG